MAWMEPSLDVDKLSHEIFSILESKFLFGYDGPKIGGSLQPAGKIRILSIDAGADGLLASSALVRLESSIRKQSGESTGKIADYFDLAAGSGVGGVLAALLFTRGADGRPLFSAADALRLLSKNHTAGRNGFLGGLLRRRRSNFSPSAMVLRSLAGATLRDAVKPLLIPCYDLSTSSPFVFSRADAVESTAFDFLVSEVCVATCVDSAFEMASVDGRSSIRAVGGVVAMGNPTAAAITHVLNNRNEFPGAGGVEDLLVLSLGGGTGGDKVAAPAVRDMVNIVGGAQADLVDQAVALAFGDRRTTNYVRVQVGVSPGTTSEAKLSERGVESVLFHGRKLAEKTNEEKLDWFAGEMMKEQQRRSLSTMAPMVIIKTSNNTLSRSSSTTFTTMASTITNGSF